MSEAPRSPAETAAVPPETPAMDRLYADAQVAATRYPVTLLSLQPYPGRLSAEAHWRDICQQLTSSRSLSQRFLD